MKFKPTTFVICGKRLTAKLKLADTNKTNNTDDIIERN